MQYKTIIHELLQQRPAMHEQLRKERKLLPTLEMYAHELKTSHEAWQEMLLRTEAGQRPEPDSQRGVRVGPEGNGGSFALRFLPGRQRTAIPRRGYAFPPPSHVARLKASRHRPTLFDSPSTASQTPPTSPGSLSGDPSPAAPTPPGALSDGTVLSPPGRASGNSVPPEGLPQLSAGTVAARAEPRLGAESLPRHQAPTAGPATREGNLAMMGTQFSLQFDMPPPLIPVREPVLTRQPQVGDRSPAVKSRRPATSSPPSAP